jgi:rhamnose utilization protein RhaD (predicted bifunctional aldolase and dehydrogenase)/NAD(P)-dependent dehydrogenase (short-subunit alcohol dehydrogenase family)
MENRWSDTEAEAYVARYRDRCNADVALRVYTARLIGQEPMLVLHGGGNTSVKTRVKDDVGRDTEVLCVKGSGWDLARIEPEGHPAVRLEPLLALRALPALTDEDMVNAQRTRMLDASGPNPSVETLLHAFLPHRYIDHSHADAILGLVDQPDAETLCRTLFGKAFGIVPYVMPGFALAKLAAEVYEADPTVKGLLLLKHGLFTFGATARESYERHVAAVDAAERYTWQRRATPPPRSRLTPGIDWRELAPVVRGLLGEGQRRYVLHRRANGAIEHFVDAPELSVRSQIGVATPDHVIRTKRFPLVLDLAQKSAGEPLRDFVAARLGEYRAAYRAYVARQEARKGTRVKALDPDPRIVLVPGVGLVAAGATDADARVAADIYEHTIDVIGSAEAVGAYAPVGENDTFDMEYWSLEQAKLGKKAARALEGQIVYVTGAARGIGAAIARRFAREGAALYLVDREAAPLAELAKSLGAAHETLDVTDEPAVRASIARAVEAYGGLDGVVSNAGTAPQGAIADCTTEALDGSLRVNFMQHHWVASAATKVLRTQGTGGFLLFNASKAAFNPGAGFGPYAVPKAALVALMKQYALEEGEHGIRANAVNADRIRTGLLNEAEIAERAQKRGLSADDYFRSNLLHREVTADDVADAFLSLALARSTTGAVLTVDGGNIAASPR